MIVQIENVQKRYHSGFSLGPINLEISSGQVVGLIGRNGAGKTTLLRLLLGALRADRGRITFFGDSSLAETDVKARIGYVDEDPLLYEWMTVSWVNWFFRSYYGTWNSESFQSCIKKLSIPTGRPFKELSRGNKVKLWVSAALSICPDLLILDEPTSGLDPVTRRDILGLLGEFARDHPRAAMLFSSHIISDLEVISDRVVMIEEGQILADMGITDFEDLTGNRSEQGSRIEEAYFALIDRREGKC